jgi:Cdc6-like AAA superfamily ATPase
METQEIIRAIKKLPISERIFIIEKTLRSIRDKGTAKRMKSAVDELYKDYEENRELTAFTVLDCENFYETR